MAETSHEAWSVGLGAEFPGFDRTAPPVLFVGRWLMRVSNAAFAAGELWAWARRRRRRLRVSGQSMAPTLADGQFVLYHPSRPSAVGALVVARHPAQPIEIVKRVASVDPVGLVELVSDNEAEGTDSRSFGRIDVDAILGTVTISLEWPFPEVGRR